MGFTVTRPEGEKKDSLFESYALQLRRHGKSITSVPRVPDPESPGRRWVHVWDTREEAQRFADEMTEETEPGWRVEPTAATPSFGPFGPAYIQMSQRGDGLWFALDFGSLYLIREAYPDRTPSATKVCIGLEAWDNYQRIRGDLGKLAREVVPPLTGLEPAQLADLGFTVIDSETHEAFARVPPAGIANGHA